MKIVIDSPKYGELTEFYTLEAANATARDIWPDQPTEFHVGNDGQVYDEEDERVGGEYERD